MSRLFLQIALGLLLALIIASGLASQLLRVQMDRGADGLAPNPVQREVNLIHWSLSRLSGKEQLARIQVLQKEFPVEMQLVSTEQIPLEIQNLMPGSSPVFHDFHSRKIIYLWLGKENGILAMGPYRHHTPFRPIQLLLVLGVILPIVGIAAYLLAAPMVSRLRELERVSRQIGKGDLHARVGFEAKDATGDLARQFNHMAKRIESLLENQKHLLGAVSHELRTPISRIEFLLEIVKSTADSRERNRKVEDIRREISELDDLVGELLLYTRYDSMTEVPPVIMTPVIPLVEDAASRLLHRAPNREIKLRIELPPDFHFPLNSNHFRRVVENLVNNAIKYSSLVVEIRCHEEGENLYLMVDDDGPGISFEARQKVFEPFFRMDEARSRKSGGAGLGLAIVSKIMTSHGGSIEAEEAPLGGTRMTTKWPRLLVKNCFQAGKGRF